MSYICEAEATNVMSRSVIKRDEAGVGAVRGAFRIGIASVRANAIPMLFLWIFAAALSVSYHFAPCVAAALQPLWRFQCDYGAWAAFANQFFFCGVIPAVFLLTVPSIRTRYPLLKALAQSLWCGAWGVVYLWFYGAQTRLFGTGHDWATLAAKTAFDQFVWSPFVSVPLSSVFFLWLGSDFSRTGLRAKVRTGFVKRIVLPNLISSWCVWIPAVSAVYALPLPLQVQTLGLVGSFWALMCLQIGKRVSAS